MIKQGDIFTSLDLQQSMHEICEYDIQRYINKKRSDAIVMIGDCGVVPCRCTPDEYATTCINAYKDIPSSAINLDQQLSAKGLRTLYKFSYKYRGRGLVPEQIVHDAYCLDWFWQMYNTAVPQKQYQDKYLSALNDAFCLSYYYAKYLLAANPRACGNIAHALGAMDAEQWPQIISTLLGIGFQFHPADIYEYSIKHTSPEISKEQRNARYTAQAAFKKEMWDKYGIDTGCLVLSSQNRAKLRKIVTRTDTPYYIQVLKNLLFIRNR